VCDNAVNLHPLRLDTETVEPFLQVMWVILGYACFVSRTAETAAIFQSRRLVHVKLALE